MRSCCEKICGGEKMKNQEIRNEISKRRLRHFEVAEACGVSTYTFSHWLQRELPETKKNEILKVISELDKSEVME